MVTAKYQQAESYASMAQKATIKDLLEEARSREEGVLDMDKSTINRIYTCMFMH